MKVILNKIADYLISHKWVIFILLFIISLAITIQNIGLGTYNFWGGQYTFYNNYVIFKNSFPHLLKNVNLYQLYLKEYADFYKYSPTFALFMATFYYLPDSIGLFLWYSLNIFVLYYSIARIKVINDKNKLIILLFLLPELILSIQNSQSNALIAGMAIMSFNLLEKGKYNKAALLITLGVFIKIYSLLCFILFLFYPNKLRAIASTLLYSTILFLLPLVVIKFSDLLWQYQNWYVLLQADESKSTGMSIFAYTRHLFPLNYLKPFTMCLGLLVLLTPLLKFQYYKNFYYRLHYLCIVLIWSVVFNYKAESPTYIIVMAAIGIWYFTSDASNYKKVLLWFTFIFTALWPTDLVPEFIRDSFFELTYVKSFFPIVLVFVIYCELMRNRTYLNEAV